MAPSQRTNILRSIIALIIMGSNLLAFNSAAAYIPVTAGNAALVDEGQVTVSSLPQSLLKFASAIRNGEKDQITGIFAEDTLAYRVVQQPTGEPGFVSGVDGVVTQFGMATKYGSIGMLAHNFAAGESFFQLKVGMTIHLVYGDGTVRGYLIRQVSRFQALSPTSPTSDFFNLESGEKISAAELFTRMYGGQDHLTLQTCIASGDESSWGRLFILAEPIL
jgi:hypothetical protein